MTYATAAEVRAYLAAYALATPPELDDPDPLIPLIDRAERDVDRVLGGPLPDGALLRVDPLTLSPAARAALTRAVAAQCEYRLLSTERSFAESEDLSGPDVTVLKPWTRVGPKVAEELAGHGLIKRTGTAAPTPEPELDPAA